MPASQPPRLQLVIPLAQSLDVDESALERVHATCYAPLLDAIERAANLRVALHVGGHVLDFLARRQEHFLLRLKSLVKRGQVEVLGGPFYGAVPALVAEADLRGQIEMANEFWDSYVGRAPQGFWLADVTLSREMPRLFAETCLRYGFVADAQLALADSAPEGLALGVLERGGHALGAFVLHAKLSAALPHDDVDGWLAQAAATGRASRHRLVTVWAAAEALLPPQLTEAAPAAHRASPQAMRRLDSLFAGLGTGKTFVSVLPTDVYPTVRPAATLRLGRVRSPCVVEHGPSQACGLNDWADYPHLFADIDTLYRRMLQVSDRLRASIATMEDEGFEEQWSDTLATAQRLVFAAQSPEAYWRGTEVDLGAPTLRQMTLSRLVRAELLLDGLVLPTPAGEPVSNGGEAPSDECARQAQIRTQHGDWDGDLCDETFVSTPHLAAWLLPAFGGEIRCIDDRLRDRNILDTGSFVRHGAEHTGRSAGDISALPRCGMRQWIVAPDVAPDALLRACARDLKPPHIAWDTLRDGVAGHGSTARYTLAQIAAFCLEGGPKGELEMQREVHIGAQETTIHLTWRMVRTGAPVRWALEIPLRPGPGPLHVTVDGVPLGLGPHALAQARRVCVASGEDAAVALDLALADEESSPLELWYLPLIPTTAAAAANEPWHGARAHARPRHGLDAPPHAAVLMPTLLLHGEASVRIELRLLPPGGAHKPGQASQPG